MASLIGVLILYWVLHISLWGMYTKAGKPGWHSIVPVLQDITLLEIVGRDKRSAIWGLIPYINFLFNLNWLADLLNSFNRRSVWEHTLGILLGFIYFPILSTKKDVQYQGPSTILDKQKNIKKSAGREWVDAIFFALVAATIIRTFNIEAYKIPTPSMEGTLLAGDFLFVSKMHYGARIPMTPVAFPLGHQTFPGTNIKCYTDKPSLPYKRLPGFQNVERGDAVVFNYPMEDDRPIDKKTHYIKRCIGLPGEDIKIVDGQVFINDQKIDNPDHLQHIYRVETTDRGIHPEKLDDLDVLASDVIQNYGNISAMFLEENQARCISKFPNVKDVSRYIHTAEDISNFAGIFPSNPAKFRWTVDNFGPLLIPKKGLTIALNTENIDLYIRAISVYEGNVVVVQNGQVFINGQAAKEYTFRQDYYFMMGDNRHNSQDSRFWGFVPEDHIVGKAMTVWMCMQPGKGFRFDRLFKSVKGDAIQKSKNDCN